MRYSNDLRMRVAKKLQVPNLRNLKLKKLSKDFEINLGTLKNWQKKLQEGTLYKIVKKGGKPRVYDYEKLREFVEKIQINIYEKLRLNYLKQMVKKPVPAALIMLLKPWI